MKKAILVAISCLAIILLPVNAYAVVGQLKSGPHGSIVNGWYTSQPTFIVDSVPGCPTGPSGKLTVGSYKGEGLHHITLRAYLNYHPTIQQIDDKDGSGIGTVLWECNAVNTQAGYDQPDLLWEGDLKWDGTPPTISISSPSNNSNTANSTIQVNGSVGDTTSGVWSVIVNGVGASVSGNTYSTNIPVTQGLNTITATAKDYAGHTSQSQVVINRTTSTASSDSANKKAKSENGSSSTVNGNNTNSSSNKDADQQGQQAEEPVAQPVKVAAGAGAVGAASLGIASYLGYVPYRRIGEFLIGIIGK